MTQPDKEKQAHDRRILLKSLRSETRPGGLKASETEENTIELTYEVHPLCQEAARMIEAQAAEIEELQARIAGLEAAIEPFSKMAGELFSDNWNNSDTVFLLDRDNGEKLTAKQFFDARLALSIGGE